MAPAKEIVFFRVPRHYDGMIGAFLNAFGILLGALSGLLRRRPLSARVQNFYKAALGVLAVFVGFYLMGTAFHGTFLAGMKQLLLAAFAVVLGYWVGKALGLQKISNHIGRYAGNLIAAAQKSPPGSPADGLLSVTLLFCAAPLGILGAVTDGLGGYFGVLALKALMDGLAMDNFVKLFRWPAALAALPVFLFLDGLAVAVHRLALPVLERHHLTDSVNATAGLLVCAIAVVIFGIRRVELANYLPALALAPVLAYWLD